MFGIGTILIFFSAVTSVLGFLGLAKKKDKLENEMKENLKAERERREEQRRYMLNNAGKVGTAAVGIAGVAAGAYYINKQFAGKDKPSIKVPKSVNRKVKKFKRSIFRKKKSYFNFFKK